jgi:hypothetical protein
VRILAQLVCASTCRCKQPHGITVAIQPHTSTQIVTTLAIAANAPVGARNVIVTNPDGQKSHPAAFQVLGIPAIIVTPTQISFTVLSGTTSSVKTVIVSNPGTATLVISSITTSNPFSLVGPLPTSISAGGQTYFGVAFSAIQPGSFVGTLSIVSNASAVDYRYSPPGNRATN